MSYAFGHLVGAWIVGKAYQFFSKKKLSSAAWFVLLLGGILPDTDFLIDWALGYDSHRTITHSLIFLIAVPILTYILFSIAKDPGKKQFAVCIGLGIATHLFLDTLLGGGIPLLWPSMMHFSTSGISNITLPGSTFSRANPIELANQLRAAIMDMAIGTAWLFYLWFRKRIQF